MKPKLRRKKSTPVCDGCQKERRDISSHGRDANGDPDAPDRCFICFKEALRGRYYNVKLGKYVKEEPDYPEYSE